MVVVSFSATNRYVKIEINGVISVKYLSTTMFKTFLYDMQSKIVFYINLLRSICKPNFSVTELFSSNPVKEN